MKSRSVTVKSGVPQGTVLGPLLFSLYINDIGNNINSTIRLFADDCLLYKTIANSDDPKELQNDLNQLVEWADKWQMRFNPSKCYHLQISRSKKSFAHHYEMMGTILEKVKSQKYLGVEISENLSWKKHIKNSSSKANKVLNFVRRNLNDDCPASIKEKAFNTMVRPHLEYAATVWDPYQQNEIAELEKIQRKGIRFVEGKYRSTDSPTEMMRNRRWSSLHVRRFVTRQTMLYKIVRESTAVKIPRYFQQPTVETRGAHAFVYTNIRPHTDGYKYSFFPRSIRCWNLLPNKVIDTQSVDGFKNALWREINEGKITVASPRDRDRAIQLSRSNKAPIILY